MIKLAIGQRWKRRDGAVVTLIELDDTGEKYPFCCTDGHWYTKHGQWSTELNEYRLDLVELIDEAYSESALEEALAHLRTLANFGGTLEQARELAQRGIDRVEGMR